MSHHSSAAQKKKWHRNRSLTEAAKNALRGLSVAFLRENNMKLQIVIYLLVLAMAILLRLSLSEIALLLMASALVMSLEIINTAMEKYLDIIEPHYHESVRSLKDVFAAAVLITALTAALIGIILLGPPIIGLLLG